MRISFSMIQKSREGISSIRIPSFRMTIFYNVQSLGEIFLPKIRTFIYTYIINMIYVVQKCFFVNYTKNKVTLRDIFFFINTIYWRVADIKLTKHHYNSIFFFYLMFLEFLNVYIYIYIKNRYSFVYNTIRWFPLSRTI